MDKIDEQLNNENNTYSHKQFVDIIDCMQQNNIDIERIEKVFECMVEKDIIPNEQLLNKMLYIVINRGDTFRIISYFDMLVELMSNNIDNANMKIKPLSIAVRALELLVGKQNDFISAYFFIDNCIIYGLKIKNKRVLSLYWQCIKNTYINIKQWEENEDIINKLIENAKDLPAQLQNIQILSILNQHRIIPSSLNELYEDVLMSLLQLTNGDNIVYDILNHWYDSYYITKDLWNIDTFNVSNWKNVELKTLLIFVILERFGDIMLNQGLNHLNIKLINQDITSNTEEVIDIIKNKLISSYGDKMQINSVDDSMITIDLNSLSECFEAENATETESDSDDESLIDREVFLE